MMILIDKEALRMVAAAATREQIRLAAYVDFPNVHAIFVDSEEARTWSLLDRQQMTTLFTNMSGQAAPDYAECIQQLSAYAKSWPAYPKSKEQLEVEAEAIYQAEEAEKTPADRAKEAKQAEARMQETHQAVIDMVSAANTALSPAEKAQAADERPQAAEKPSTAPQERPRQGQTKKIWDIADDLLSVTGSVGNIKEFRKEVIARAEAMGLNAGTAATQFGHWKRDKGIV